MSVAKHGQKKQGRPRQKVRESVYAERLQEALDAARIGPEKLSELILTAHPKLRGATYSGIRAILEDRIRRPRREVVAAAAEILGNRSVEYLMGESDSLGPPALAQSAAGRVDARARRVVAAVEQALGIELTADAPVMPSWAAPALDLWHAWADCRWLERASPDPISDDDAEEYARQVAGGIASHFASYGRRPAADVDPEDLHAYVLLAIAAASRWVEGERRRRREGTYVVRERNPALGISHSKSGAILVRAAATQVDEERERRLREALARRDVRLKNGARPGSYALVIGDSVVEALRAVGAWKRESNSIEGMNIEQAEQYLSKLEEFFALYASANQED